MNNKNSGFSFIEAVTCLLFIAVTGFLVTHFISRQPSEQSKQVSQARQDLRLLENAVAAYMFDLSKPAPSTETGIQVLVDNGYLSKVLIDPWGKPYKYRNPGQYDVIDYWSQGPDGVDSEDDIVGWDPYGSYVR